LKENFVEEDRDVHRARLGHAVVARPVHGLVPLPYVAFEGRLGVELELVDIKALAVQLLQRRDQAGVVNQSRNTSLNLCAAKACAPRFSRAKLPRVRAAGSLARCALARFVVGEAVGKNR
jgi:hypothetical protein